MVRLWYSSLEGRVASYYRYQVSVYLYDAGDYALDQQIEAMWYCLTRSFKVWRQGAGPAGGRSPALGFASSRLSFPSLMWSSSMSSSSPNANLKG